MIWKKRKKVILDCFTSDESVYKNYPIQPSRNAFPEWWKKLPNYNDISGVNMKYCFGMVELYKNGFFSPLWCDIDIDISNSSVSVEVNDSTTFDTHGRSQYENFIKNVDHYKLIKILSPWTIKTKELKKFFLAPAFWNGVGIDNLKMMNITPGIIEFSLSHTYNLFMLINTEKNEKISLKQNQVISHLVPLFEEKIVIKNHLVSEKELNEIHHSSKVSLFTRKHYYKAKKLK